MIVMIIVVVEMVMVVVVVHPPSRPAVSAAGGGDDCDDCDVSNAFGASSSFQAKKNIDSQGTASTDEVGRLRGTPSTVVACG